MLQHTLEHQIETELKDEALWLKQTLEKVARCSNFAGDKYSMKMKHSTILSIEESLLAVEEKKNGFVLKYDKVKPVLNHDKTKKFEEQRLSNDKHWSELNSRLQTTR